jgi:hypothetical protein
MEPRREDLNAPTPLRGEDKKSEKRNAPAIRLERPLRIVLLEERIAPADYRFLKLDG